MNQASDLQIGVLLVNLGTPDTPSTKDVRKYLREFLMDWRVIDMPYFSRFFLINGIIAPFRAPKSAKVYNKLWTERGSPLLFHGLDLKQKVQEALPQNYHVAIGMRYQKPDIASAIEELRAKNIDKLIVLPLYPQYASASTGTTVEKIMDIVKEWQVIPSMSFINRFADHPLYIKSFASIAQKYMQEENFDHFLFSYHGLPESQILKASCDNYCKLNEKCCSVYHKKNRYCYRAQCFETSRLLAKELGLSPDQYTVSFQSRLGKNPWIKPYTDEIIKEFPARGIKKVLAFSPAFVADCLETTIEVGEEFDEIFKEAGGERWQLVESLNSNPIWVEAIKQMIMEA